MHWRPQSTDDAARLGPARHGVRQRRGGDTRRASAHYHAYCHHTRTVPFAYCHRHRRIAHGCADPAAHSDHATHGYSAAHCDART